MVAPPLAQGIKATGTPVEAMYVFASSGQIEPIGEVLSLLTLSTWPVALSVGSASSPQVWLLPNCTALSVACAQVWLLFSRPEALLCPAMMKMSPMPTKAIVWVVLGSLATLTLRLPWPWSWLGRTAANGP